MSFLNVFFKKYIDNNYHTGLSILSLYTISSLKFELEIHPFLALFIFSGTVAMYNFIKYYPKLLYKKSATILTHLALCFLSVFYLKIQSFILSGIISLIGYLYITELFPKKKNLRNMGGVIKIFSVAFSWTMVVVGFPLTENTNFYEYPIEQFMDTYLSFSLQIFVFVAAIMIPFEIGDLKNDKHNMTIPYKFGIKKAKKFGVFLSIVFLIVSDYRPIDFIICAAMVGFIAYSKSHQHKLFALFWVENIPVFWLFLEVVSRFIVIS